MIIGAIPGEKKAIPIKKEDGANEKALHSLTENRKEGIKRKSGDKVWSDSHLAEFPSNDHRLFIGNLDQRVSDTQLFEAFSNYKSILKAKVVVDNNFHKHPNTKGITLNKGYGFISFGDADDARRAVKEMQMKYVGNKPIKVIKSKWKDKNATITKSLLSK